MEGDKEAYLEEASKALKRQRKILDELLAEKTGILRQLRVTKSKQNRNKDAENAAKIARLAEEQDTLIIMIKREIQALKDLGQDHLVSFWIYDAQAHNQPHNSTHFAKVQKYEQGKIGLQIFFNVVLII